MFEVDVLMKHLKVNIFAAKFCIVPSNNYNSFVRINFLDIVNTVKQLYHNRSIERVFCLNNNLEEC